MKIRRWRLGLALALILTVVVVAVAWAATFTSVKVQNLRFGQTEINADASETLTIGQSGVVLVCTNASGSTTVTVPEGTSSIEGVIYWIVQTAAQDVVITTATANNNDFVADGVATSDNVTLTGSGHQIGNVAMVIGTQTASSTWKWVVAGMNPEATVTAETAD